MPEKNPFEHLTFERTGSGLWVPSGEPQHALGLVVAQGPPPPAPVIVLPFRPVVRDGMMAYVTEGELGLEPLGKERITAALALMPSELTLQNLALLLKRLARIRTDAAAHLELARQIYDDAPVMDELGRFCAVDGHVIFSEQGLFALMSQAVIHCREDAATEFTPDEWLTLKRLLLAAPGLLHDDVEIGEYEEGHPEQWLAYITQNLLFNATANFGSGLARTWRLYGELAVDPSRHWKTPLDFGAVVEETGLTIEQQLALGFSLYSIIGIDTDVIAILPEAWRDVCQRVAPDLSPDEVIMHVAGARAEFRAELTGEQAQKFDPELRWGSVPFIERPFVRLGDDRVLLISPRGIEGWPTNGVHYRLLRAASKLAPKNGAQHFTSFAGELTESATIEMVEDAHRRACEKHLSIGHVKRARPLRSGGESTDLIIVEGGDVVLIEISSSRITASTRLTGDQESLRRDLWKLVVKRVKQLDRTVEAILAGEFEDVPANHVKRIFPVIANIEPMRWSPMLHAFLRREVPGLLRQRGVRHLQFIEIEDLEALMSVLGPMSLARLIDRKLNEADIDADFQQWFHDSPIAPQPKRPPIVDEQLERLFSKAVTQLGFSTGTFERWQEERRDSA